MADATSSFGLVGAIVNASKTYSAPDQEMTALLLWSSEAYKQQVLEQEPTVEFTGSIDGTTLTVVDVTGGNLGNNQFLYGQGIKPGTRIISGEGTSFEVNIEQTVAEMAIDAYGSDLVAYGLFKGTLEAWTQAAHKFIHDYQLAQVETPPAEGWQ